jgi:hypothetical protein
MPERHDDFYVGYQARASSLVARRLRVIVVALFAAAIVVGALLAASQRPFSDAAFEFGNFRQFEGRLVAEPHPLLDLGGAESPDPHLLVVYGKGGVEQELSDLAGSQVRAEGQLIYRDEGRMIELSDAPLEATGALATPAPTELTIGRLTLIGEIVDSKCYLGVMKPGTGKPHRSCAARCISGGVPPSLLVKGSDGSSRLLLLSDDSGRPLGREILGLVAQPVSVTGTVSKRDGLWQMRAAAADFRLWTGDAG